jgi:hypothetical protein
MSISAGSAAPDLPCGTSQFKEPCGLITLNLPALSGSRWLDRSSTASPGMFGGWIARHKERKFKSVAIPRLPHALRCRFDTFIKHQIIVEAYENVIATVIESPPKEALQDSRFEVPTDSDKYLVDGIAKVCREALSIDVRWLHGLNAAKQRLD